MEQKRQAVLSLGANLGDRLGNLRRAVQGLDTLLGTRVQAVSPLYETEPFDVPDRQQNYFNCCVLVQTGLQPQTLLGACLGIEAALGKVRTFRNAARLIDIDLLLYEGERMQTPDLILPHPRMMERAFVLVPLRDLFPNGTAMGLDFSAHLATMDTAWVAPHQPADGAPFWVR